MNRSLIFYTLVVLFMLQNGITEAAKPNQFRFKAEISDTISTSAPVRLQLTAEMLMKMRKGYPDLRIFDQQHKEIPYVVYNQYSPAQSKKVLTWKIESYDMNKGIQTLFLSRTADGEVFHNLTLSTAMRDFNKIVSLHGKTKEGMWMPLLTDELYDFSSHVDVTKKGIECGPYEYTELKLEISPKESIVDSTDSMHFKYKDLEFSLIDSSQDMPLKIDRITSYKGKREPEIKTYDSFTFKTPDVTQDAAKNTVIEIGPNNLPVDYIYIGTEDRFFHRSVEIYTSTTGKKDSYRYLCKTDIYRIPGIQRDVTQVTIGASGGPWLRIVIKNHDNPPLEITYVRFAWLRRNVFFIPDSDQKYTLFIGSNSIEAPVYDMAKILPNNYLKLMAYNEVRAGVLTTNPDFDSSTDKGRPAGFEKTILIIVISIIALILAVWIFSLMKKIPEQQGP